MKLYYSETLNPYKACALARHLGSSVEFVRVDLAAGEQYAPDFLALNPNGKVPLLVDGETVLWESNAIMAYLARKAGSDMLPEGAEAIELIRWLGWDADHFSRAGGTLYFEHIIKPLFLKQEPNPKAVAAAEKDWRKFAVVLDAHLAGRRYLIGERLTIADFAVAVALPYAEKSQIPLDEFAAIRRWHDRLNELNAWREPFPVRQAQAA